MSPFWRLEISCFLDFSKFWAPLIYKFNMVSVQGKQGVTGYGFLHASVELYPQRQIAKNMSENISLRVHKILTLLTACKPHMRCIIQHAFGCDKIIILGLKNAVC